MLGRKPHLTTPPPFLTSLLLLLLLTRRRSRNHNLKRHFPLPGTIHPPSTHPIRTIMLLTLLLLRNGSQYLSSATPTSSTALRPRTLRAIRTRVVGHAHWRRSKLSSSRPSTCTAILRRRLRDRDALLEVVGVGVRMIGMRV
jgi:hypothetical protein